MMKKVQVSLTLRFAQLGLWVVNVVMLLFDDENLTTFNEGSWEPRGHVQSKVVQSLMSSADSV